MQKTILSLIFACLAQFCLAQKIIIKSDAQLYLFYGANIPVGNEDYGKGKPALLSNMRPATSWGIQYAHRIWRGISVGASVAKTRYAGWKNPDSTNLYAGTTVDITSFSSLVMIRSRPRQISGSGKIGFFASLSPGLNQISTKTSRQSGINDFTNDLLVINSMRFGIGYNAGLEWTGNTSMGVFLSAGYQSITADSKIYSEKNLMNLNVRLGIFVRLFKDRRYRYSGL